MNNDPSTTITPSAETQITPVVRNDLLSLVDFNRAHLQEEASPESMSSLLLLAPKERTTDEKGRLLIPRIWLDRFKNGWVLTISPERCLWLFPVAEFHKVALKLISQERLGETGRGQRRLLFDLAATGTSPDKSGRIRLPEALMQWAEIKLNEKVRLVGKSNRIEIWNPKRHTKILMNRGSYAMRRAAKRLSQTAPE